MSKLRIGSYRIVEHASDHHPFKKGEVVLICGQTNDNGSPIPSLKSKGGSNGFFAISLGNDVKTGNVEEKHLSDRFNSHSLDILKGYFTKELKNIGKIEEAINDIGKEDITAEEFLLYVMSKVNENKSSTKQQKLNAIKAYVEAL